MMEPVGIDDDLPGYVRESKESKPVSPIALGAAFDMKGWEERARTLSRCAH